MIIPRISIRAAVDLNRVRRTTGLVNVRICITVKRKRIYYSTPYNIRPDQWDPKSHQLKSTAQNSRVINSDLRKRIHQMEQKIFEHGYLNKAITPEAIRDLFDEGKGEKVQGIFQFGHQLIEELRGKFAEETLSNYITELKRIDQLFPGITFDEFKPHHLAQLEKQMIDQKLSNNTIFKSFKVMKKLFNVAIQREITSNYPFRNYSNPKYEQTDRTYLSEAEVDRIEALLDLPLDESIRRTVLYFLLGCFSGLRFSDWLRFGPAMVRDDRLILRAKKNGEFISLKIHDRLKRIIDQITDPPFVEQTTNQHLKAISRMADIDKKITSHVARHSFAVRCAEYGISVETTAQLMGITVKTCAIYYKVTNRKIDSEFSRFLNPEHKSKQR